MTTPDMTTRRIAARLRRDEGAALILTLIWTMGLLAVSLVVVQSVIRQIQPSDRAEQSYSALDAAEAGVEDYRARLLANPTYYSTVDATNPAFTGWVSVPGGESLGEYRYIVDARKASVGGGITLYSMGRSRGVTRLVVADLARRSTLDYVYMSDME